jgi:hypothetical protein
VPICGPQMRAMRGNALTAPNRPEQRGCVQVGGVHNVHLDGSPESRGGPAIQVMAAALPLRPGR